MTIDNLVSVDVVTEVTPFDITIEKCAVIRDPFGTRLCILDLTKGLRPPDTGCC